MTHKTTMAFLCDNALITQPVICDNLTIAPIENRQMEYIIDWGVDFCAKHKLALPPREFIRQQLSTQVDRIKPTFVVYCTDLEISIDDHVAVTRYWRNEVGAILGAIAFTREAYPRPRLVFAWEWEGVQYRLRSTIYESYYRGNIVGGPLAGEGTDKFAGLVRSALSDVTVRALLDKYRLALSEQDLDLGYFRFWSLLESMCHIQKGRSTYPDVVSYVTRIVDDHRLNHVAQPTIEGAAISLPELIAVWYEGRNLTAHHGGVLLAEAKGKKMHGTFARIRQLTIARNGFHEVGVDYAFLYLKDVVRVALKQVTNERANQRVEKCTPKV